MLKFTSLVMIAQRIPSMLSMIVSVVSLTGTANRRLVLPIGFRIYQYAIKLEIGHNLLITNGNMDL